MCENKNTEVLGDLVKINKDCSHSLEQLMEREPALSPLIQKLVDIERDCLLELRKQVDTAFGDPADKVERRGEILKGWEERNRHPVSRDGELCAFCEKKLKDLTLAYNKAIQKSADLSEQVVNMLQQQMEKVRETFALVLKRSRELGRFSSQRAMVHE